jgi:hypothetical protein
MREGEGEGTHSSQALSIGVPASGYSARMPGTFSQTVHITNTSQDQQSRYYTPNMCIMQEQPRRNTEGNLKLVRSLGTNRLSAFSRTIVGHSYVLALIHCDASS